MLRAILGLIAGIVVAFLTVIATQYIVNLIFPLPKGLNVFDRAQVEAVFRAMPASHFALILLTYFLGGFLGSVVALKIGRAYWPLWVTAALIALSAALNVFTYPHPVWAQIGAILLPLAGGWLAMRILGPPPVFVEDDLDMDDAAETTDERV